MNKPEINPVGLFWITVGVMAGILASITPAAADCDDNLAIENPAESVLGDFFGELTLFSDLDADHIAGSLTPFTLACFADRFGSYIRMTTEDEAKAFFASVSANAEVADRIAAAIANDDADALADTHSPCIVEWARVISARFAEEQKAKHDAAPSDYSALSVRNALRDRIAASAVAAPAVADMFADIIAPCDADHIADEYAADAPAQPDSGTHQIAALLDVSADTLVAFAAAERLALRLSPCIADHRAEESLADMKPNQFGRGGAETLAQLRAIGGVEGWRLANDARSQAEPYDPDLWRGVENSIGTAYLYRSFVDGVSWQHIATFHMSPDSEDICTITAQHAEETTPGRRFRCVTKTPSSDLPKVMGPSHEVAKQFERNPLPE